MKIKYITAALLFIGHATQAATMTSNTLDLKMGSFYLHQEVNELTNTATTIATQLNNGSRFIMGCLDSKILRVAIGSINATIKFNENVIIKIDKSEIIESQWSSLDNGYVILENESAKKFIDSLYGKSRLLIGVLPDGSISPKQVTLPLIKGDSVIRRIYHNCNLDLPDNN